MKHVYHQQIDAMIKYKQREADTNQQVILMALHELGKPSSSKQIEFYLKKRAIEKAQQAYEESDVPSAERDAYIRTHSKAMNLRTIQRWLKALLKQEFVNKKENKYLLANLGKREIQFMNFAKGYGNVVLNSIMDCHFPTRHTQEENLSKLVEVFGLYVVNCFIEAARLISANESDGGDHWHSSFFGASVNFDREGKFRERRLVINWIKDVFNPWHMFNLFLTTISNYSNDNKNTSQSIHEESNDDEKLLKRHARYYEPFDISLISKGLTFNVSNDEKTADEEFLPPTSLDLMVKSIISSTLQKTDDNSFKSFRNRNRQFYYYGKMMMKYEEEKVLCQLNQQEIKLLKDVLRKKHKLLYDHLTKAERIFYHQL
jgi:hypothetical protein